MADFANKLTILINDKTGGWSETYYLGDIGSTTIKNLVAEFRDRRAKVLGSGCAIVMTKWSSTNTPRIAYRFRSSIDGAATDASGSEVGVGRYADSRDIAILMPCRTIDGTLRNVVVSGAPDAWVLRNVASAGEWGISSVGADTINGWYNYLFQTPGALMIRQRLKTGAFEPKNVSNITENTDGRYLVETEANHALASGDKVVISKYKGNNLQGLAGTRKVYEIVAADAFTIDRGPRSDLGDVTLNFVAKYAKVGYSFELATKSPEPYQASTRQRGRGFSQRRGRRSARK